MLLKIKFTHLRAGDDMRLLSFEYTTNSPFLQTNKTTYLMINTYLLYRCH